MADQVRDLHAAIVNLSCEAEARLQQYDAGELFAYRLGHRDARHAAAELAASHAAEVEALRADAERYRWLRANAVHMADYAFSVDEEVEAVVDAALKGDKP